MNRPTIAEIAALTARLRVLSDAGRAADPDEVARFLADKDDLIDRITADTDPPARGRDAVRAAMAAKDAVREVARARAAAGGYALVGPSARTWHIDDQGRPTVEASDAEHRAIRELLQYEALDAGEPAWIDAGGGQSEIVSTVVAPALAEADDRVLHEHSAIHNHAASPSSTEDERTDYRIYTHDEATAELTTHGVAADQAAGVVERYLDGLSWDGWSAQDQWEIDDDDIDVMLDQSARADDERRDGGALDSASRVDHRHDHRAPAHPDAGDSASDAPASSWRPGQERAEPERGLGGAEGTPIPVGPVWSARDAARELANEGHSIEHAETLVRSYLDAASEKAGVSVDEWGLEPADLDAIRAQDDTHLKTCVDASHEAAMRCYGSGPLPGAGRGDTAEGEPVDLDRIYGCCRPLAPQDEAADEAGFW